MVQKLLIGLIIFAAVFIANSPTVFGQTVSPTNSPLSGPRATGGIGGSSTVPGAPATGFP